MKQQDKPKTVVAIGDLHAGSRFAICPPTVPLAEGGEYKATAAQSGLYESWAAIAKAWHSPDVLICNGDMIEGQARKESGVGCWSTDLYDQLGAAETLLRMFAAKEIYMIIGTGYHVDSGGKSLEHHLGERMGAVKIGSGSVGQFAGHELFLRVGAFTFHAAHHISVGTGWYKATPLSRELVFCLLNESDYHKTDIVLRSHVHYFCGVEFHRQRGYTLPCWQLRTPYMLKKSAFGMTPSIGAVRFRIHDRELRMDKQFVRREEARPTLFTLGSSL